MAEGVSGSLPAAPQQLPGLPQNVNPNIFEVFNGIDTKSLRPGVPDSMMAWCDGFMPVGPNNLRTLWDVGAALFTASAGNPVFFFQFGNIGQHLGTPVCMVFLSDGSIVQVNSVTGVQSPVAPPATITTTQVGMSQYGNQYIIIVANQPNGYFLWDGTNLFTTGGLGPQPEILNTGVGYTSAPSVFAYGGNGSGSAFTATVDNGNVVSIAVNSPGTGYLPTDVVYLGFTGGGIGARTAFATAGVADGVVTATSINDGGAGYTSAAIVTFVGGGGTGATGTVNVTAGSVVSITITNGGNGYTTLPNPVITDVNNPVAVARIALMPSNVRGTSVETYASRVWVSYIDEGFVSAPGSPSNFSPADAGAIFTSNDPFLRVGYTRFIQSNGFLYLVADSSINYISGVTVSGSPAITTFNNQNVDPQIGTPYPNSVQVFSRNIVFANEFGVHVSYGGAVTKISQALDGVYNTAGPNFGGLAPSAAVASIFGIQVYIVLVRIVGPISGDVTNKMFMWDGKKWWSSRQTPDLIFIASQEINSQLTAYGTDGLSIYPLFAQPSDTLGKIVQSKLWSAPSYMYTKSAQFLFGIVKYYLPDNPDIRIAVDNENSSSQDYQVTIDAPLLTWTNNSNQTITWTNNSNQPIIWFRPGLVVFGPQAVSQTGALTGLSIQTAAKDVALVSATLVDRNFQLNM